MAGHLKSRFGDQFSAIQALQQSDGLFWEICMNYEEVCTWLVARTHKKEITTEERTQADELIRELEIEIEKAIGKATSSQ